ncbi:MAG: hypothetical protein KAH48_10540 [Chlorobi bacterium]|nr:hypothetical protein [Chlorobiota bacterium]
MKISNLFLYLIVIILSSNILLAQENETEASVLAVEGVELINSGEYIKAIELFDKAMLLDPTKIEYPYEKAIALYRKHDFKDAAYLLDSLTKVENTIPAVFRFLGNCYDYMSDTLNAVATYDAGIKKFPLDGSLYFEYGTYEYGQKHNLTALGYWQAGIYAEPNYPYNYFSLSQYNVKTRELLWASLYAEVFMNLSNNVQRIESMSQGLANIYDLGLFKNKADNDLVKFTKIIIKTSKPELYDYPFELDFQHTMQKAKELVVADSVNAVSIKLLIDVRAKFIELWYAKHFDQKYPNFIFDMQKQLIAYDLFAAYNYWLFKITDEEGFKDWYSTNAATFDRFIDFMEKNKIVFDDKNRIHRSMYSK